MFPQIIIIVLDSKTEVDNFIVGHQGIKGQRGEEKVVLPGRGCMRYTIRGSLIPKGDGRKEGRKGSKGNGRKERR